MLRLKTVKKSHRPEKKFDAVFIRDGREKTISSTVYYGAAMRHLQAWFDGEDLAPDSGVHHLAHVMACCAMVLDGQSLAKLNDNRPPPGALPAFLEQFGKEKVPA
jgi:hypothetical protein